MAKKTNYLTYWFIILFTIVIVLLSTILSGFSWNTFRFSLSSIPQNIFTCLSYNNSYEAFQMDCFIPHETKPFYFKNKLTCTAYTNQSFGKSKWRKNDTERNSMTFVKSDYIKFSIEFLGQKNMKLSASDGRNIDYKIIKDTDDVIQGIGTTNSPRLKIPIPTPTDLKTITAENFITLSKKYGKGMEVWHNGEWYGDASIGSFFFQCE